MQARHRLKPVPALDGLRGLAVAAVVLFHFSTTHNAVPGGQFGVDVFFVLSGFLVTAGLLDTRDQEGRIAFRPFISRRAWRLVPALAAFLAVFLLMALIFGRAGWFSSDPFSPVGGVPVTPRRALTGVLAAAGYVYNIVILRGVPTAMPLAHLWTLAIEGQFYVGWALLLGWLARSRRTIVLLPLTGVIIAGSAVMPWLIYHGGLGENHIYFGTLPRLQQLLAGALLAQVWRSGALDRVPMAALRWAGALGGLTLLIVCFRLGETTFKYLGAETLNAAAAVCVVAYLVVVPAGSWSSTMLSTSTLRWLGTRSYAIYLWHWPMAVWTNEWPDWIGVPVGIAASLVLAELSWRLVEVPAQQWRKTRAKAVVPAG